MWWLCRLGMGRLVLSVGLGMGGGCRKLVVCGLVRRGSGVWCSGTVSRGAVEEESKWLLAMLG